MSSNTGIAFATAGVLPTPAAAATAATEGNTAAVPHDPISKCSSAKAQAISVAGPGTEPQEPRLGLVAGPTAMAPPTAETGQRMHANSTMLAETLQERTVQLLQ